MIQSSSHYSRKTILSRFVQPRRAAIHGVIASLALLMPLMAAAESQIDSGAATTALNTTAHVNFKIVIPNVLFLNVASGNDRIAGAQTVAVMSTGRSVTMNGTVLNAAAKRSVAQDVPCTSGNAHSGPVVCTASMP